MTFDATRAHLGKPDMFPRFEVAADARPSLVDSLSDDEALLVFERNGEQRGLLTRQMAYHHVAQGKLAGEPYLITF